MKAFFDSQPQLFLILLLLILFWLLFLTVVFFRAKNHYRRLANISSGSLEDVLNKILAEVNLEKKQLEAVKGQLLAMDVKQKSFFNRMGIVRFNPFGEVGGKQSFSLAVLDENSSGFILTAFHNRNTTRVYAKIIKDGQAKVGFSKEEKLAFKKANEKNKVTAS